MRVDFISGLQDLVFVYGSNELGIHGAGAVLDARLYWGARQGQGAGISGALAPKNCHLPEGWRKYAA